MFYVQIGRLVDKQGQNVAAAAAHGRHDKRVFNCKVTAGPMLNQESNHVRQVAEDCSLKRHEGDIAADLHFAVEIESLSKLREQTVLIFVQHRTHRLGNTVEITQICNLVHAHSLTFTDTASPCRPHPAPAMQGRSGGGPTCAHARPCP